MKKQTRKINDAIRQAAINSTSVIAGGEYDNLTNAELKHKAARFDALRYGNADPKAAKDEGKLPKGRASDLEAKWDAMSDETKKNFREAWKIWKRMRKAYRQEKIDGQSKEAQPKIKDWQTKVMKDLYWDVSESRLRDVKEMGKSKIIK
ncbi:MAG: hypothetical protein C4586_03705 [Anaerolineaceae bacterium]|nr:MAG: hypothetical protein C4586_03705 [Anaerolineaceae bacterium]